MASLPLIENTASFRSRLTGTWGLLRYSAINTEDREDVTYPMGNKCKGLLFYSHDGYMAALIQWPDVEPYKVKWTQGTTSELANAAQKSMMYSGRYYLDEQPGNLQKVLHHPLVSIPPNWIETIQLRVAEMTEGGGKTFLTLGPEQPVDDIGTKRFHRLEWQKLERNDATRPPAGARELQL